MSLVRPSPSEADLYDIGGTGRLAYIIDLLRIIAGQTLTSENITDATATQVKTGSGFLGSVIVNSPQALGTISLYDGTADTDPLIAAIDTSESKSLSYDVAFSTGLYAVPSAASAADITITYS